MNVTNELNDPGNYNLITEIEHLAQSVQAHRINFSKWMDSRNKLDNDYPEFSNKSSFENILDLLTRMSKYLVVVGIDYVLMRPTAVFLGHKLNLDETGREVIAVALPIGIVYMEAQIAKHRNRLKALAEETRDPKVKREYRAWNIASYVMLAVPAMVTIAILVTQTTVKPGMLILYLVFAVISTIAHFIVLKSEDGSFKDLVKHIPSSIYIDRNKSKAESKFRRARKLLDDDFKAYLDKVGYQEDGYIPGNFTDECKTIVKEHLSKGYFKDFQTSDEPNSGTNETEIDNPFLKTA